MTDVSAVDFRGPNSRGLIEASPNCRRTTYRNWQTSAAQTAAASLKPCQSSFTCTTSPNCFRGPNSRGLIEAQLHGATSWRRLLTAFRGPNSRGLIEARNRSSGRLSASRTSAAQTAAASLKQKNHVQKHGQKELPSAAQTAAASLKQRNRSRFGSVGAVFRGPNSRGLIEALFQHEQYVKNSIFRGPNSRGLIEAERARPAFLAG